MYEDKLLTFIMKTPERWRALPSRALFVSILAWKTFDHIYIENLTLWPGDVITSQGDITWRHAVTSYDLVMSHRDVIWCHVTWQSESAKVHPLETLKIRLCDLVTLTFDPWPWPLNLAEIISRSFATPNFVTLGQTVQPWERWLTDTQTHRFTDRRDRFHTLDRWRGRELRA